MVPIQFASSPTDPTWEPPRWRDLHVRKICFGAGDDNPAPQAGTDTISLSERAQALDDAASALSRLCATGTPLSDIQEFMAPWMTTATEDQAVQRNLLAWLNPINALCWVMAPRTTTEAEGPKVQRNLLAWFNDTNALRWACDGNNEALVRFLLDAGLTPNETAVVHAVAKARETRDPALLDVLLDAGWDINKPLGKNATPLLGALIHEQTLVWWCLARGASPNASSGSVASQTIMERAAAAASPATLKLLVRHHGANVAYGSLVAHASRAHAEGTAADRVEAARFLLDEGAPADAYHLQNRYSNDYTDRRQRDATGCCGMTEAVLVGRQNALHFAAWSGKADMARLLLENGAMVDCLACSPMKTDNETMTPLELAEKYGHDEIAELLRVDWFSWRRSQGLVHAMLR